jgi:signal transduction histidine kinase
MMAIFVAIIAVGAAVQFTLVNLAVNTQFRRFVATRDQVLARNLAPALADYYAQQGSWQGVEALLVSRPAPDTTPGMMGPGMMPLGHMGPPGQGWLHRFGTGIDRVVVADSGGVIVADSANLLVGQQHPAEHLSAGVAITVGAQQVGTVLVGSMVEPVLNPLDQDFLRSVNLATLASAVAVGVLALALGSLFFFQVTAPVRALTKAIAAVAGGDLSQRVAVKSKDEIGQMATAFNTMAAELQRAEALRRNLVADVAHELRTPLSLVRGNLEAMLDGLYEMNRENVAAVHDETLVLARLVDDLRDLALAEAGRLELEVDDVDVGDLVLRVTDTFRAQAAQQAIALRAELPDATLFTRGDEQRLRQVLTNLLSNALRYTPAGGQVRIAASLVTDDHRPGVSPQAEIRVAVSDTGEGIPAEELPNLFERFYRTDKSRARSSGGSGLGLSIARQLVEAHGGRIWADSQPGVGSTFTFAVPAR